MRNSQSNSYRIFARWAAFSYQNAVWIILLVLLLTSLSTVYTVNNLGVHTDTTDMLSEDVPFRANNIHYKKSFSQYEDTFLLVLDAPTPEQAHQAAKRFTNYLEKDSTQFSNTYYLTGEPFFEQNGLFFKSLSELGRITDYLRNTELGVRDFYYLSGNPFAVKDVFDILSQRGVPRERIVREFYYTY